MTNKIKSVLFGVAIGDALGVPVEFSSREDLRLKPVSDMTGFGSHMQPPGTFSYDSSLTFCLADALTGEFDLNTIGQNFVKWRYNNFWTARGSVFDVGGANGEAIENICNKKSQYFLQNTNLFMVTIRNVEFWFFQQG